MRFLFRFMLAALLLCSLTAGAEERVTVCFNYGCFTRAEVIYDEGQLRNLAALVAAILLMAAFPARWIASTIQRQQRACCG